MTAACHPLPQSVAEEMLQVVARALCDRPADNPAQRESRTRQMVHATLGIGPRDGLEYMLATLMCGHFNLILDSIHDVFHGQLDGMKARTKSTIVTLDRALIALLRELRTEQARPLVQTAKAAEQQHTVSDEDVARPEAEAPPPPRPAAQADPTPPAADGVPAAAARHDPPRAVRTVPAASRSYPAAVDPKPPAGATPDEADDMTTEEHIVAFELALASLSETLNESRARDNATPADRAASGD